MHSLSALVCCFIRFCTVNLVAYKLADISMSNLLK